MRGRPNIDYVKGQATFRLASTDDGSGVSTLRMQASANTTLTLIGDANFYSDSGGTADESKIWTITSGALRTIYLKCATSAKLIIPEQRLITHWGDSKTDGWTSGTNAASISSAGFPLRYLTELRITGSASFVGAMPSVMTYFRMTGSQTWTYSGALPTGLIILYLNSDNINWTHSGTLPTGLTALYLIGNNINWTAFDVSGTGNIGTFLINNFVTTDMTAAQLITLLTSMAQRTGNLPATCKIGNYSNDPTAAAIAAATGDAEGTDAEKAKYWIDQIFANKATTQITLQGTNIDKP